MSWELWNRGGSSTTPESPEGSIDGINGVTTLLWVVVSKEFVYFHPWPLFGEDEPILTNMFQMGGSTTN